MRKFFFLLAFLSVFMSAQAVDYYLIGDNVNGKSWSLKAADAKFTETATAGVYTLDVAKLGTGFKINNGAWSSANYNIGAASSSAKLTVGTPFSYTTGSSSQNISFNGVTMVENATVTLDTNAKTILVTGKGGGEFEWFVAGLNDTAYSLDDKHKMSKTDTEGIFEMKDFNITAAGSLKVTTTGWGEQYGTNGSVAFSADKLSNTLEEVSGETGNVPYTMTGKYNITWDYNNKVLSFASAEIVEPTEKCATPSYSFTDGKVYESNISREFTVTCTTPGAKIHYTLDGTEPTEESALYTGEISINYDFTLKARAYADGYAPSDIATGSMTFTVMPQPKMDITPDAATASDSYTVTLSPVAPYGHVYYYLTNDLSTVKPENEFIEYTEPFTVTESCFIVAQNRGEGKTSAFMNKPGQVLGDGKKVPTPYIAFNQGIITQGQWWPSPSCILPGASIYYTLDGTDPTTESPRYSRMITIRETTTFKALAVKEGYEDSDIATYRFEFNFPNTPVISSTPDASVDSDHYVVTLSCETPDAEIYWFNGKRGLPQPDNEEAHLYDGNPIVIRESCTFQAAAYAPQYGTKRSNVSSVTFNCIAMTGQQNYFLIGDGVNGKNWSLKQGDAQFLPVEGKNGVYTLTVTTLKTGFKVNDGTWSNDNINFGSNGSPLVIGEPYKYGVGGATGNIAFKDATVIENAVITLDVYEGTLLVEGIGEGEIEWYVAGLNDTNFALDDAHLMSETDTEGVYEIKDFNITSAGSLKVTTTGWGEQYGDNDSSAAFTLANLSRTLEPVAGEAGDIKYNMTGVYDITWDYNTKTLSFTQVGEDNREFYLIGTDVNGHSWQLKDATAKFEKSSTPGVYNVHVSTLGAGFKINDGTWTNVAANIGSNGPALVPGTPYTYGSGSASGNILFADNVMKLLDVDVELNLNNSTITVTGTPENVDIVWYAAGLNDPEFNLDDAHKMTETDTEGVFELANFNITETGSFKITTQNWMESYGAIEETAPITPTNLSSVLSLVSVECEVPYSITGTYTVRWTYPTRTVEFIRTSGVDSIFADDADVELYRLDGVKVTTDAPAPGIYIRRQGGNVTKVYIK